MQIDDILSNIDEYNSDMADNDMDYDEQAEPTMAELAAIEEDERRLRDKRKTERASRTNEVKEKPVYVKPKPKVKAVLPENLFSGVAQYKKTVMASMAELNKKAEQEVKDYYNRIVPLIVRGETEGTYKFASEELMHDFFVDYQDAAMQKGKLVKRYMLDMSLGMYDLYKVIGKHLGLNAVINKTMRSKQQKEETELRERDTLPDKYALIEKSGYIVSRKDAEGYSGLKALENQGIVEEVQQNVTEMSDITDVLTITAEDYKLLPINKLEATVLLCEQAERAAKEDKLKQEEGKNSYQNKTIESTDIKEAEDNVSDYMYDSTLSKEINEDNQYLRYVPGKRRSVTYMQRIAERAKVD